MNIDESTPTTEINLAEVSLPDGTTVDGLTCLDTKDSVWLVEAGAVDVFFVNRQGEKVTAPFKHVVRVESGFCLFTMDSRSEQDNTIQVVAKPLVDTKLKSMSFDAFIRSRNPDEAAAMLDFWISGLTESMVQDVLVHPQPDVVVEPHGRMEVERDQFVTTHRDVVWLPVTHDGLYLGLSDTEMLGSELTPLTPRSWIKWGETSEVKGQSTEEMLRRGNLRAELSKFHALTLHSAHLSRRLSLVDAANRQVERTAQRQEAAKRGEQNLEEIFARKIGRDKSNSNLQDVLEVIGKFEKIEFKTSPDDGDRTIEDLLRSVFDISSKSKVRSRIVNLSSQKNWWHGDNGALLGFLKKDSSPVALIPRPFGRYRMVNPATGISVSINKKRVDSLLDYAYMFFPSLPNGEAKVKDVLKIIFSNSARDLLRFTLFAVFVALFTFVPSIAIGVMVNYLLPSQLHGMVTTVVVGLSVVAIVSFLFHLAQHTTLLRLEGRGVTRITAAIWDRILRLRQRDTRQFKSGDLLVRATVFYKLRNDLSGLVASSFLSAFFLVPALGLLYVYDVYLTTATVVIGVISVGVISVLGVSQYHWHLKRHDALRTLNGNMVQFIDGISKLRTTSSEDFVFAFWTEGYKLQKRAELKLHNLNAITHAFSASLPILGTAVFLLLSSGENNPTSPGGFLTVYIAAMIFFVAIARFATNVGTVAAIRPAFEQIGPILKSVPEDVAGESHETESAIRGDVRLDHVNFRYENESEWAVEDINLHVRYGEFVAIVGESGSGKSTILKLLLGLETPDSGVVYFDNRNLSTLDLASLRRQIGVVTQNVNLQPGTILQNIIGTSPDLNVDDAWEAARRAQVDGDIREMDMQMFTPVSSYSQSFSGGQIQRIILASALVNRPRLIILDEATNWLDNRTQSEVMQSVNSIAATRIVIAHRLSTIRDADQIHVMSRGRIVQSGTFDELMNTTGLFRELADRQLM